MSDELKAYYRGKAKKPELFGYDDEGNLVEYNKDGEVIKTIALPSYRPPTFEEFDEMEKQRMEEIAVANKEFEDARKELRNALTNPETPDSEVLRINRKVKEADIKLQAIRFPLRYIESEEVQIREIDFDQPQEKRKLPYEIAILVTNPFILEKQYARIGKVAEKPLVSVAEAKAAEDATVPVILFAEPETNDWGFLSLKWAVELELNGTMYNSAQQALYAEIAKGFNDQANLEKIMLAETPDAIEYSVEDVPGDKEVNEIKWNTLTKQLLYEVNLAKFNQFPELAGRLLETKNAQLGAYEPDDNLIGIGISLDNIQSKNPVSWTGQNLLGKALMDIRDKIRTDREAAATATATAQPRAPRRRPRVASVMPAQIVAPVEAAVQPVATVQPAEAAPQQETAIAPESE